MDSGDEAEHANRMAQILADEFEKIPQISITQKVQSNGVFALCRENMSRSLQKEYFFYVWNEEVPK